MLLFNIELANLQINLPTSLYLLWSLIFITSIIVVLVKHPVQFNISFSFSF